MIQIFYFFKMVVCTLIINKTLKFIDLDLKSAHLNILAGHFKASHLRDLLYKYSHIWMYFIDFIKKEIKDPYLKQWHDYTIKKIIKITLYTLLNRGNLDSNKNILATLESECSTELSEIYMTYNTSVIRLENLDFLDQEEAIIDSNWFGTTRNII